MKRLIIVLLLFISVFSLAQETTTFILVRHAEKASDGTANPALTEAGVARANSINTLLQKADISAIYSTNYKRTRLTVIPLAESKKIEIKTYDWKNPQEFVQALLRDNAGGTVVISGHSNTTPMLANLLLGEEKFAQFADDDYGNLLVITSDGKGKATLLHLRY